MTWFKHLIRSSAMLSLVGLVACNGPYPAPLGAYLVVPETTIVSWDVTQAYNAIDVGYGLMLLFSFAVRDAENYDFPVNNVQVEVLSSFPGAYLLPQAAIQADTSVPDGCAQGFYPPDECALWFGDQGTEFSEIADGYVDIDHYHPTYMATTTDRRGLGYAGLFIDTGLDDGGSFELYFSVGVADASTEITFLGPDETTTTTTDTGTGTGTGDTGTSG